MIISFSETLKWGTCQRQYYYNHILGRRPVEESSALMTGNRGHTLLHYFYELMREGHTKEEALKIATERARKEAGAEGKVIDFDLLKAWTLVSNYIAVTDFTAEAILIEERFLIPATHLVDDDSLADVQIGFTPDVVFKRTGNKLDIEDAKFVGRAWSKSKRNRFPQIKLYQLFLEALGYEISRGVIRFFNTKTAEISTQSYTMTKVEGEILLRDFMSVVREIYKYKQQTEEEMAKAPRTMNYSACQFCSFEFVCSLQAEGKDASKTLNTQFKESKYAYNR
jgi:hypothetical protein